MSFNPIQKYFITRQRETKCCRMIIEGSSCEQEGPPASVSVLQQTSDQRRSVAESLRLPLPNHLQRLENMNFLKFCCIVVHSSMNPFIHSLTHSSHFWSSHSGRRGLSRIYPVQVTTITRPHGDKWDKQTLTPISHVRVASVWRVCFWMWKKL